MSTILEEAYKMVYENSHSLSIEELRKMNNRVVQIINSKINANTLADLSKFYVGQNVFFEDKYNETFEGKIIKINRKTLTIMVGPIKWKVSPSFVRTTK